MFNIVDYFVLTYLKVIRGARDRVKTYSALKIEKAQRLVCPNVIVGLHDSYFYFELVSHQQQIMTGDSLLQNLIPKIVLNQLS